MAASIAMGAEAPKTTAKHKTVLHAKDISTHRPKAPLRLYIECLYGEGIIEFNMSEVIDNLDFTISTGSDVIWCGHVTTDEPTTEIPILRGEYQIDCVTDGGMTFSGSLIF